MKINFNNRSSKATLSVHSTFFLANEATRKVMRKFVNERIKNKRKRKLLFSLISGDRVNMLIALGIIDNMNNGSTS